MLIVLFAGIAYADVPLHPVAVSLIDIEPARGGVLRCAIFQDTPAARSAFPMDDRAALSRLALPANATEPPRFEVPAGTYAVACAHDENENGRVDTNFVGIPKEGWATSNNVRPMLREPSFVESAVTVSAATKLDLVLHY